jgi:hypothetical protein
MSGEAEAVTVLEPVEDDQQEPAEAKEQLCTICGLRACWQ